MDAHTQKNQSDEIEQDWPVQKFGLPQPQRFDLIQAEPPLILLTQVDKIRLYSQGERATGGLTTQQKNNKVTYQPKLQYYCIFNIDPSVVHLRYF